MDWDDLAYLTAERFGGTMPHPETGAAIATVYARAPKAVTAAIDRVATEYDTGTVRSPWGLLKSRVAQIPNTERAVKATNDHIKALERAEQWIRNAGMHFDSEPELLDELFGDRGMLRAHNTEANRSRILEAWHEARPTGVQLEHEHEARMAAYARQTAPKPQNAPSPNHPAPQTAETVTEALA